MTEDKKIVIEHGILDHIDQNGRITQTELARSLRVSIGLVNAYLRNLVNKGYVKVSNVEAATIKYMLTPEGLAQKYYLTRSYMTRSLDYYRRIKQAVESRIVRLKMEEVRTVVFVGNGEIAEIMLLYLGDTKIKVSGIFTDEVKPGEERVFFGYKLRPMEELKDYLKNNDVDKIVINYFEEIEEKQKLLLNMGIEASKIDAGW
jgi:DNA-binding MarR family transcriptional regulator